MFKLVISVVAVIVLGIGGFFFYQSFQTKPASQPTSAPQSLKTPAPTSSPTATSDLCEILTKGNADIPPLYSGIQWQQPIITKEKIIEYDENYNQSTKVLNGCVVQALGMDTKLADEFDDIYYNKFESNGWREVFSADGPDGSVSTHKKQNEYLLIEKRIDPKISSSNNIKYNLKLFYTQ